MPGKKPKSRRERAEMLDLSQLTLVERLRVEKVLNRRDTPLSLKFRKRDVDAWRTAAKIRKEDITEWIERALNIEAAR